MTLYELVVVVKSNGPAVTVKVGAELLSAELVVGFGLGVRVGNGDKVGAGDVDESIEEAQQW